MSVGKCWTLWAMKDRFAPKGSRSGLNAGLLWITAINGGKDVKKHPLVCQGVCVLATRFEEV